MLQLLIARLTLQIVRARRGLVLWRLRREVANLRALLLRQRVPGSHVEILIDSLLTDPERVSDMLRDIIRGARPRVRA